MFPGRYELNILLFRSSKFGLCRVELGSSEGSQTSLRVKFDHKCPGTRLQGSFCWPSPAAV
jgi:hypothetical protein